MAQKSPGPHPDATQRLLLVLMVFSVVAGTAITIIWGKSSSPWRNLLTPFFEEPLKLAVVLLPLVILRAFRAARKVPGPESWQPSFIACLVVGWSFGLYEHFSSYPSESGVSMAMRLLTHPGYLLLGLAAALEVRPGRAVAAWLVVACGLHFANNAMANTEWAGAMRGLFVLGIIVLAALAISIQVARGRTQATV